MAALTLAPSRGVIGDDAVEGKRQKQEASSNGHSALADPHGEQLTSHHRRASAQHVPDNGSNGHPHRIVDRCQ